MTGARSPVEAVRTTHGTIALSYLEARIDGLERGAEGGDLGSRDWADLVDLMSLRARILGRVADYERASAFAEERAAAFPDDGLAFLARARSRANLHRFAEATDDLRGAVALGLSGREIDVEMAALLQATGGYDGAMAIRRRIEDEARDFESAAGMASLHAEMGESETAESWFDISCGRYRSVSPFAMAELEFQRGHMWMARDLDRARHWLAAASERLPRFAQAAGHLAEVDYALGNRTAAIASLRRLAAAADDPDFAAELATMLRDTGRQEESEAWRARAETRYAELLEHHPAAFADHGARFWLGIGADPTKVLALARRNLEIRDTPKARRLVARAMAACADDAAADRGESDSPDVNRHAELGSAA
jgi:tetratricopeptide (TPR) repeat protein